jgi:hypothetical protein
MAKIAKLEEESRKLREIIAEKEEMRRKTLKDWDGVQREGSIAALRSDLAEQQLRALNDSDVGGAAF